MHVADPAVLGFDVDEIDLASQGVAVRLDQQGLGADEVVGAGGDEQRTGVAADESARRYGLQVRPVLVAGADEPGEGAFREAASFRERREIIGRTVEHHAPGPEGLRAYGQGRVFRSLGHVKGKVAARRIAGQEHPVLVEMKLPGVDGQVIQRGGAVGQFVGDVRGPVVHPVLQQHDIIALPEENGGEAAVVLPLPGYIETAVDVDEDGILAHIRSGVVDVHNLLACPAVDIRDGEFLLQGVSVGRLRRDLVGPGQHHLEHRARHLEAAAAEAQEDGNGDECQSGSFHFSVGQGNTMRPHKASDFGSG